MSPAPSKGPGSEDTIRFHCWSIPTVFFPIPAYYTANDSKCFSVWWRTSTSKGQPCVQLCLFRNQVSYILFETLESETYTTDALQQWTEKKRTRLFVLPQQNSDIEISLPLFTIWQWKGQLQGKITFTSAFFASSMRMDESSLANDACERKRIKSTYWAHQIKSIHQPERNLLKFCYERAKFRLWKAHNVDPFMTFLMQLKMWLEILSNAQIFYTFKRKIWNHLWCIIGCEIFIQFIPG